MDILNSFHGWNETAGRIDPGGCFLDCRYFAEKMISGIGAHRRFASVSTKIGIGKERFCSGVTILNWNFLPRNARVWVTLYLPISSSQILGYAINLSAYFFTFLYFFSELSSDGKLVFASNALKLRANDGILIPCSVTTYMRWSRRRVTNRIHLTKRCRAYPTRNSATKATFATTAMLCRSSLWFFLFFSFFPLCKIGFQSF